MEIENQSISVFIRETLLRTPQGLVVLASFVINWLLVILVSFFNLSIITPDSGTLMIYIVILPWPFAVLLAFLISSSPHYKANLTATVFTAASAIVPYWLLYA
jgi:hypothetical protein